ncbi:hypothetical protein CDL15_Pgr018423 [Punica granatum]|nr:hypothetical protein CDL15_Pgr018423 [Punica granatum]
MKPLITTMLASMTKAKACASAIKLLFSMLRSKKQLLVITGSIPRKLVPPQGQEEQTSKDYILFQADQGGPRLRFRNWWLGLGKAWAAKDDKEDGADDDDCDKDGIFQVPDLTHSMFNIGLECAELDEEEEGIINGGSVVELVRSSREELGQEFQLEDEIDRVADMFIRRFHLQQRMQRQLSLKSKKVSG